VVKFVGGCLAYLTEVDGHCHCSED
jgi:hypothetical protein